MNRKSLVRNGKREGSLKREESGRSEAKSVVWNGKREGNLKRKGKERSQRKRYRERKKIWKPERI